MRNCLLLILIIQLSSCCKDNDGDNCALPDLTGEIMAENTEVPANTDFDFDQLTENIEEVIGCTETADSTNTGIIIDFAPTENSTFETVFDEVFPIPSIDAGDTILERYGILFERKGIYILETRADKLLQVEERREDNNDDAIDALGKRLDNDGTGLVISVTTNPSFKPEKGKYVTVTRKEVVTYGN